MCELGVGVFTVNLVCLKSNYKTQYFVVLIDYYAHGCVNYTTRNIYFTGNLGNQNKSVGVAMGRGLEIHGGNTSNQLHTCQKLALSTC